MTVYCVESDVSKSMVYLRWTSNIFGNCLCLNNILTNLCNKFEYFKLGDYGSDRYHQVNKQYFYDLRQKCLESKLLFEDPVFPASDETLLPDSKEQYEWLRPS